MSQGGFNPYYNEYYVPYNVGLVFSSEFLVRVLETIVTR